MKNILLLGAGMVAKPITNYLLNNGFNLTIASRTLSKAENLIKNKPKGKAIEWTTNDLDMLDQMVAEHDITVSLLPYTFHVIVAKTCIKNRKHLITTSYVSNEMKAIDKSAREAGILILNEIGVDPGFDHMTAKRIIDKVQNDGGKIKEFYSLCGALAAPEEANNPFRYKFTWSPPGVLMAANNGAKYLKDGEIVEIPTEKLFKNPMKIDFPGLEMMEVYPNRDSLAYIDLYNLKGIKTMYRGTFRYPNWCASMDAIKSLGMLSYKKQNFVGKIYKDVIAEEINVYPKNVKEKVAEKLKLDLHDPAIESMEWLGFFENSPVSVNGDSTFDLTADLMLKKMMLPEGGRDMVIMLHSFLVENADGTKQVIKSRLLDFATEEATSIARTVALPAAIAVKMILEGKIKDTGVHIPVSKSIYEPVLNELETLGISMTEEWGLPEHEKLG